MKLLVFILLLAGAFGLSAFAFANYWASDRALTNSGISFYEKYGGYERIKEISNEVGAALLSDPLTAPYFASLSGTRGDDIDRFLSCLDLQFISLFGGPDAYPGNSFYRHAPKDGYSCGPDNDGQPLVVSKSIFDRTMLVLVTAMKTNEIDSDDIDTMTSNLRQVTGSWVGN